MTPSVSDILNALHDGGYLGLLIFAILGLARKWVVFGYQLKESEDRVQEWKNLALSNMRMNERTLDIADTLKRAVSDALSDQARDDDPPPPRGRRRVRG